MEEGEQDAWVTRRQVVGGVELVAVSWSVAAVEKVFRSSLDVPAISSKCCRSRHLETRTSPGPKKHSPSPSLVLPVSPSFWQGWHPISICCRGQAKSYAKKYASNIHMQS